MSAHFSSLLCGVHMSFRSRAFRRRSSRSRGGLSSCRTPSRAALWSCSAKIRRTSATSAPGQILPCCHGRSQASFSLPLIRVQDCRQVHLPLAWCPSIQNIVLLIRPQRQLQHLPVTTPVSAKPPTSFMSSSSWVPSSYWSFPVARRTSGAADVPLVALPVGLLISRFSIHTFSSGSSSILLSILLRHASVCSILPLARRQVLPRNQCILACAIFFQDPVGDPDTVTKFHLSTHSKFKNPRPTSTFS